MHDHELEEILVRTRVRFIRAGEQGEKITLEDLGYDRRPPRDETNPHKPHLYHWQTIHHTIEIKVTEMDQRVEAELQVFENASKPLGEPEKYRWNLT